jgi:hypothetical protein
MLEAWLRSDMRYGDGNFRPEESKNLEERLIAKNNQ